MCKGAKDFALASWVHGLFSLPPLKESKGSSTLTEGVGMKVPTEWADFSILTHLLSLMCDPLKSYPYCSIFSSSHKILSLPEFKHYLKPCIVLENSTIEVFEFPSHVLGCHL